MSEATVSSVSARDREMLALACTPKLGPTRVRRLFERIANVEDIFRASLTELEAIACQQPALSPSPSETRFVSPMWN